MRRHIFIAAVTAALAAGGVAGHPAPASAAPVFDDAASELQGSASAGFSGSGCTGSGTTTSPAQTVPVPENGGAAKVTGTASTTVQGAPGDSIVASASLSGTASVTSSSDQPRSIDVAVTGQVDVTSQQPVSACSANATARATATVTFTVARPVYLQLDVSHSGPSVGAFYLSGPRSLSVQAGGQRSSRTVHVLLPAGAFVMDYEEIVGDFLNVSRHAPTSTALHLEFRAPGAATVAPAGKGLKYVALPAAASCAGHSVDPVATNKRKRAKKIRQVELFIDDTRVAKVKHPKKGAVVHLPVAPGAASELRAEITLEPKAKGRKPKTLTATASYEACP